MAILSRPRLLAQQRFDLEDFEVLLSGLCADAKFWTGEFWGPTQFIVKGFNVSGLAGPSPALIAVDGSVLINANNTGDFSWFAGASGDAPLQATLLPGTRNYLELELTTENGTPLTRAFWDPSAQGGLGAEFNQTTNTVTNIKVNVVVLTGGFSGSPDRVKLAMVDTDGSNNITQIFDERDLFFRLGTPSDPEANYSWGTQEEPELTLTLTGVSGTFVDGETVTFDGSETAEVQSGGTTTVGVILPSAKTFSIGDTVVGSDSGATGTLAFAADQFSGVDKSIDNLREMFQAFATEIKSIKGTRFWFETGIGSISGINNFLNSHLVENPPAQDPQFRWDGTNLEIFDDDSTPSTSDVLASVRFWDKTDDFSLTRQEKGLELQTITFDAVPDAGSFTVDFNGDVSDPINFDDDAADFQAAWDAQISESVAITGSFTDGFQIQFLTNGDKVAITENSNTLEKDAVGVNTTITETKKGQASDNSLAIADGEILFVKIPSSGGRTYSGSGSGDTNYQTTPLGSFVNNDENYWLAYREGSRLHLRFAEDLVPGQSTVVSGGVNATLLASIGLASENSPPSYTSNIRGAQGESLVSRASILTDAVGDSQEDRSGYLRSDDVVTWTGTQLEFAQDIILEILNTKDGTITQHEIDVANSPISVADGESLWVKIDRGVASETLTVNNSGTTPIPAQDQFDKDVFILFRRVDALGVQRLHIPFHKQVLEPGQSVVLGASGSGGGGGASLEEDIKRRLVLSPFTYATPNIFEVDKDDKVDGASTGAFSPADSAYELDAAETMVSTQNLDSEFLGEPLDIASVEVYLKWLVGSIDPAATYELSRDGGNEWQAVTMTRIGETNAFRGIHIFDEEAANQNLDTYDVSNADTNVALTDTGNNQARAQGFTPSTTRVWKEVDIYVNKLGSPSGTLTAKIVADDTGAPSTSPADILSESDPIDISAIGSGDQTVNISLPDVVLVNGTQYWLVIETDAAYKASYNAGVDVLRLRADTSSPGTSDSQEFNGTVWATVSNTALTYLGKGREHDLRLRVTGSTTALIEGYGVLYGVVPGITTSSKKNRDQFFFTGDENRTEFTLSWTPDPDLLVAYDPLRGKTYVAAEGVFRIDGQTIKFDTDFFDLPGEDILLEFRQNDASSFDNSDQNANAISAIQSNLIDIGDELASISDSMVLTYLPAPHTQIQNRALIPDLSADLKPRLGIDRLMAQKIYEIQGESGPNGEPVYGVVNDELGQIRFVGAWQSLINSNGVAINNGPGNGTETVEVTFYGTGLNMLGFGNTSTDVRYVVDGGPESSNIFPDLDGVLLSRNYSSNSVIPIISGLSLGIHTVKLRAASTAGDAPSFTGFEILNEESSGLIQLPPGSQLYKGKKLTHSTLETTAYNSDFETGTLGTRGGHVLIYQKSDGSVAKAVTPTNSTQQNLGAANHSNEEIIRKFNFREFGAGRTSDDFSVFTGTSDRAFTLDDGTTTLVGNDVSVSDEFLSTNGVGDFITLTFVGTGLDIVTDTLGSAMGADIYVDGSLIGSDPTRTGRVKIVSGLPYGTHTVKIESTFAGFTSVLKDFIIYGPKKPTLPAGAVELGSYFIMADFAADVSRINGGISTGVLRKYAAREFIYSGSNWSIGLLVESGGNDVPGGISIQSNTVSDSVEYTFWGTGIVLTAQGFNNQASAVEVEVDGSTNLSGFTTSVTSAAGVSFTPATGIWDQDPDSDGAQIALEISGMSLGLHTVKLTANSIPAASVIRIAAMDVITPIHTPKQNTPYTIQSALAIGSQGISDLRKFSNKDVPVKRIANENAIFQAGTTFNNSDGVIIVPGSTTSFYLDKSGFVSFNGQIRHTRGAVNIALTGHIYIDGKAANISEVDQSGDSGKTESVAAFGRVWLSKGWHTASLRISSGSGTNTTLQAGSTLLIRQED